MIWLNANDEDSLKLSFRGMAHRVLEDQKSRPWPSHRPLSTAYQRGLEWKPRSSGFGSQDLAQSPTKHAVALVTTIMTTRRQLAISVVDICRFLPRTDHGSIIITTRSAQVHQGYRIHIQVLRNVQEGLEILPNTSRGDNIENGR
ncbi:hypothetical protein PV11_03483 [Exophiala sideris]|uniref:Uncharacterized protein n=1 Tax=Exophiala sideris TaxID=1016849 RepID=A0A0D1YE95_9EURO|nr:hypothetical protein PV11_03483 [Exophiala sideris]